MTKSLFVGLGLVAASIGYMVGSSHTPVINVAVPAVFGLVVTTFGLLQRHGVRSELQALLESHQPEGEQMKPETATMLAALSEELRAAPRRVGVALIVCSLCYMPAAIGGSFVRGPGHQLLRPFPWPHGDPPENATVALEWLSLQEGLLSLGYSAEQVLQLYALDRLDSPGQTTGHSAAPPPPVGGGTQLGLSSMPGSDSVEPPRKQPGPGTSETALPDELSGDLETFRDHLEILLSDRVDMVRLGLELR